jgi:anaerobic magnesium-protoporphyrin IX monomethyl ester cyclase
MRVVLADIRASRRGFVSKDTVAGGYGSRLVPFSRVTKVVSAIKRRLHDLPSVQMAYLAAILAEHGHEVRWTRGASIDGDVALVLSSLVEYRSEVAWADAMRARGVRVGFVGLAASKVPELFVPHADFVVQGEPEAAIAKLAAGAPLAGLVASDPIEPLDRLPLPRWDLVGALARRPAALPVPWRHRARALPVLASRGCPEFCTYCPHRILARYRARSVASIVTELRYLADLVERPYVVFRDPLFTADRARCLALARRIVAEGLPIEFECETRLDRLDPDLLDRLYEAGLRAVSFGVESVSPQVLRRVGRRPIPPAHQRQIVEHCHRRGIATAAYYVFGFPTDTWESIAATIEWAVALNTTAAQFKLLTPYPGTPLWKQLCPLLEERDLERFDGYTPTFRHPSLSSEELRFLLGAAYTRFYMRPSYLAALGLLDHPWVRRWLQRADRWVAAHHERSAPLTPLGASVA